MRRAHGFTLIEILIALSIFSIMAGITSSVLYSVFNARDKTTEHAIKLAEMQLAFVLIERDLSQIVFRPIKTAVGKETSVMGLESDLRFSRGGIVNPLSEKKQSTLSRVHYFLQNKTLKREMQMAVNRSLDIPSASETLLSNIDSLKFEYLDENNQPISQWYNKKLPYAIRISLKSDDWGELSQIYSLSQSRQYYAKK